MENRQYQTLANKSPIRFNGERVVLEQFLNSVAGAIRALNILNDCKRELLCENGYTGARPPKFFNNCSSLPAQFEDYKQGEKVISAILNLAIESKGLLEKLEQTLKNRNYVSVCGMHDNIANMFQHQANIAEFLGTDFDEMMQSNIGKLKNMNPERFNPGIDEQVEIAMFKSEQE